MVDEISATYLGMPLHIEAGDAENGTYFSHCAKGQLHLQRCKSCHLLRYPPTTGCPWCGELKSEWSPVDGRGTVHSYGEVHHAIQPAFREALPYLVLMVDLDDQKGQPSRDEAIRITGNLVAPDGSLASPELVKKVGIGSRVKLTYVHVEASIAIPQWTLDEEAVQPENPWRYPCE